MARIKSSRPGSMDDQYPSNYLVQSVHSRNLGTNAVVRGVERARDDVGADDYASMLARAKESY